jgi:exonuclease SbcD
VIKILHTADLHLDAPFPSLGEKEAARREDFFKTFERLLTLAIKNDVHLFVVAGDLFDSPCPSAATVSRVQAGLKRLADRGIVPVLLPGTHDNVATADSVYRRQEFSGAILLDTPIVEDPVHLTVAGQDVYLYGFAYRNFHSGEAFESLARRTDEGLHIGVLHGSRQGSPEWDYRKKDLPFTLPLLKKWGLDYVALGHYHTFEILGDEGRPVACYPGSPEGKRFRENGPRYCALVSLSPDGVQVEKLLTNTRVLETRTRDLSGCEDFRQVAEAIRTEGSADLLLRLILTGIVEAPLDLEALHAGCSGEFFHLEFQDETRLFDSDFARRIEQEETVRGLFVRRAREAMEQMSSERRSLAEEAFREVLVRFRMFGEGAE